MTSSSTRPRLAATINTVQHLLHGQHILDRFLDGYGWEGTYHHPQMDLVSLYVDQIGAQYPVERTLLTNGILIGGVDSLFQNRQRMETPHLNINYQPNPQSTFWRS